MLFIRTIHQAQTTSTEEYLHVESSLAQQAKEAYVALTAQERLQRQATPLGRVGPQLPGGMGPSQVAQLFPGSYLLRRVQLQQYMQQLTLTLGLSKTVRVEVLHVVRLVVLKVLHVFRMHSSHRAPIIQAAHSACALMDYVMLTGMLDIDGFETLLAAACLVVMVQAEGMTALPAPQLAALLQLDPGAMMALEQQVRLRWQHGGMAVCAYHFLQVR